MNYNAKVEGNTLTITVDLSKRLGPSKSGKTVIIASTGGNQKLNGKHNGIAYGLNVYTTETGAAVKAA